MIGVIVNPHARRNLGKKGLKRKMERALRGHGSVIETLSVDAILPALRQFADEGRRYWVADGGDGALHWMINEAVRYFGATRAGEIAAYLPSGGGSIDFVTLALGLPRDPAGLIEKLVKHIEEGTTVPTLPLRSIAFEGTQVLYGDEPSPFRRVAFGTALAGYGGNFFGPLREGNGERSPVRIARLMATAFAAAAGRAALSGPLERLKPRWLVKAEYDFLRALRAEVRIDGAPLRGANGEVVHAHTALNCSSVNMNLAGILRVFPLANGRLLHVHAGNVTPVEMARLYPLLMTGRSTKHLLPNGYDGAAETLDVLCDPNEEMSPVLDGEMFFRVTELHGRLGPMFNMVTP